MIKTKLTLILILLILSMLLLGCQPSQPASTSQATVQPSPTGMATNQPSTPSPDRFAYEGVSFALDPAIASVALGQTVLENPGSQDGPYWDIHPAYTSISLDGYPISGTLQSPVISVYPVDAFRELNPAARDQLDSLKDFLATKPVDVDQIPFLPIYNAGQVFHTSLDWLDFQDGSGIRFLTLYAQYPAPINNQDLFYTFQGLTSDGRYAVSIIMPVNHPSLPADLNAVSQSEMDGIVKDYDQYRVRMAAELSDQPEGTFIPDLAKLDTLVASLAVEP